VDLLTLQGDDLAWYVDFRYTYSGVEDGYSYNYSISFDETYICPYGMSTYLHGNFFDEQPWASISVIAQACDPIDTSSSSDSSSSSSSSPSSQSESSSSSSSGCPPITFGLGTSSLVSPLFYNYDQKDVSISNYFELMPLKICSWRNEGEDEEEDVKMDQDQIILENASQASGGAAYYVEEKNVVYPNGPYDVFEMDSGEICVIYQKQVDYFNVKNSTGAIVDSKFSSLTGRYCLPKSIMMLASNSLNDLFKPPMYDLNEDVYLDKKLPVVLLEGVSYVDSYYDGQFGFLHILFMCEENNSFGYMRISYMDIAKNIFHCEALRDEDSDFLYRAPINSFTEYTIDEYKINASASEVYAEMGGKDKLYLIHSESDPIVLNDDELEEGDSVLDYLKNANIHCSTNGYLSAFFHDELNQVRCIFSIDSGVEWKLSPIIFSRHGFFPLLIDTRLFYFKEEKNRSFVRSKNFDSEGKCAYSFVYKFIENPVLEKIYSLDESEGDYEDKKEEIQQELDDRDEYEIDIASIPPQKIKGNINSRGETYIYYYNQNFSVSGIKSNSSQEWEQINL
jgi:hypothetical protein